MRSKNFQKGRIRQQTVQSIGDLKGGNTAKIVFIREEQPMLQRFFEAGLTIGAEVSIEETVSAREAIEVNLGASNVLMGRDVAAKVFVELVQPIQEKGNPQQT